MSGAAVTYWQCIGPSFQMEAPKIEMSDQDILELMEPYDPWNPMFNPVVPCGYCLKPVFTSLASQCELCKALMCSWCFCNVR